MKHFKLPRKEINRLRKDFKESKEKTEEYQNGENLKDFEELAIKVFDFFEEITGKKVNREIMKGNLFFWFDEGYSPPEMEDYLRAELLRDYFKENPERFTIAVLFPIKDQERINTVWDLLQHYFTRRTKVSKQPTFLQFKLKCGHMIDRKDFKDDPSCLECIRLGSLEEIIQSPYRALRELPSECVELREVADWFTRHFEDFDLQSYSNRTWEKRKEIMESLGKKIDSSENILNNLKKAL